MLIFRYEVEVYEVDGNFNEIGVVIGKDFADAAGQLESYYGSELCDIKCLRVIEDGPVFSIKKEDEIFLQHIEDDAVF